MKASSADKHGHDEHWNTIARAWREVGSPLRPSEDDLAIVRSVCIERWRDGRTAPRVLLLGVTPELYNLDWPQGTDFLAIDHNEAMIRTVWPGPPECVRRADWIDHKLPPQSCDIVLCDGGLHLFEYPEGQRRLVRSLRDVLAPGGLAVLRLFLPPAEREPVERIMKDLLRGTVRDLNVLKLRLWAALQKDDREGVCLGEVWRVLHEAETDQTVLAEKAGWTREHLEAVNSYRDSEGNYHLATLNEVEHLFRDGFRANGVFRGTYELADRCPTVVFERLPDQE